MIPEIEWFLIDWGGFEQGTHGRLDQKLVELFKNHQKTLSRTQIHQLMEQGLMIAIDQGGSEISLKKNTKIGPWKKIRYGLPKRAEVLEPKKIDLSVLFEDEHLIIINKPPGLIVHPTATKQAFTLVHALLAQTQLSSQGEPYRPGIVHRLDQWTSGVLVAAKSDECYSKLCEIFANHEIQRIYWALVFGHPEIQALCRQKPSFIQIKALAKGFQIESLIGRSPVDRKKMSARVTRGKRASTQVQVLKVFPTQPAVSLVQCNLLTGRTHQIRVHFNSIGHPVLGDPVYGKKHLKILPEFDFLTQGCVQHLSGQMLHARSLGFLHPITGQALFFEADPFFEMSQLIKGLNQVSI